MRKVASADYRSIPSRNLDEWSKKTGFFPFLDRFRALRESCVADQSCRIFFYSRETRVIWRQTWQLILLANRISIDNWTVVGRGYFSHELTQRKRSLCSPGIVLLNYHDVIEIIKQKFEFLLFRRQHFVPSYRVEPTFSCCELCTGCVQPPPCTQVSVHDTAKV